MTKRVLSLAMPLMVAISLVGCAEKEKGGISVSANQGGATAQKDKDTDADESGAGYRGEVTEQKPKPETRAPVVPAGKTLSYNFEKDTSRSPQRDRNRDTVGKLPTHFHSALTGQGAEGTWVVKADPTAPSKPNVLAQSSTDMTDYRFPLAIADEGSFKDLDMSVTFKAVAGKVDQGAGLVFRYQDHDNYYVVRANALEDNYNLYHVVKGERGQIEGASFRVSPNEWHTLRVEVSGNKIKCYYDGKLKITATDNTFKDAGKVGLWTKADSVIYFDDLSVTAR